MKSKRNLIFATFLLLIIPVLTACGGPARVDAALTTYNITLDKNSVNSGEVTFHIHNDAKDLNHEFVVFKTDLPADQLPLTSEGIVDEEDPAVTLVDEAEDIEPGASTDLTVNLDPGHYALVCNVDSGEMHYQHGMHTDFTVK